MIGEPQCLVVNITIGIALVAQVFDNVLIAPARPVVTAEQRVGVFRDQVDRLVQVLAP